MSEPPRVVVLGGCNGAGKTTASRMLLAETLGVLNFVNADQIAQGLSGFAPERALTVSSRIMVEYLHDLAQQRRSFAFETTLAGRVNASFLRRLRKAGYRVEIYYFWLASVELSIQRVAARVAKGGHDVPESTLRRRYPRSVRNFLTQYRPIADRWEVYDNSAFGTPILIAAADSNQEPVVADAERYAAMTRCASDE